MHRKQMRAQKPYICAMCFCEIPKGTQYIRLAQEDTGFMVENKLHIHCDILREACPEKNRGSFYEVHQWISRKVCHDCGVGECEGNPFACGKVMEKLVPAAMQGAAQDSLRECEGWV